MAEFLFKQQAGLPAKLLGANSPAQIGWRTPALAVAATGVLAVCAHISIPLGFTPVPLTMQTFAVLLLGMLFSPRAAFATMALYLAEGAAGLPVFSSAVAGSGFVHLFGPDGGYLLCYPFAAALASAIYRAGGRRFAFSLGGAFAGAALILAAGALWLSVLSRAGISTVIAESVVPFLAGDAVKAAAAAACVSTFRSIRKPAKSSSSATS